MNGKECSKCGQNKPLTEFYQDSHSGDGRQSWCKACRRKNDRMPKAKARYKRYRESEKGKKTRERDRERYPERHQARHKVNYAVFCGHLPRANTQPCAICGNAACQYHHHKGYAKKYWLDVILVCQDCHTH